MTFFQTPPVLGNTFDNDDALKAYLQNHLPEEIRNASWSKFQKMGELAGGELYHLLMRTRTDEPRLTPFDPWGHRIDSIELTELWKRAEPISVEFGLISTPYLKTYGQHSRLVQMALMALFHDSTGVYTCPLAMTDGATKTLSTHNNKFINERALPHLLSTDPKTFWTSGQWMTERTGGSDVGICETKAIKNADGTYSLSGTKWFTSATTSQMALTLGRTDETSKGSAGLALFYVETRQENGRLVDGLTVNRLKEKLGTRMVPTAELTLDRVRAWPVVGANDGVKNISPMLGVTRLWNTVVSYAIMRRAVMLAKDYAKKRVAFGAPLSQKPLHLSTLAHLEAETRGAMCLAFFVAELLGKEECGAISEQEALLLRLLTPVAKLMTAKQAVAVTSEVLECFGGAGYIEDTGLPQLLRDAQVLPIWEGTTNVLSLDVLRVLTKESALAAVFELVDKSRSDAQSLGLKVESGLLEQSMNRLKGLATQRETLEFHARQFALILGRAVQLSLLVNEAKGEVALKKVTGFQSAAKVFAPTLEAEMRQAATLDESKALLNF